jgi:hypothetical protein
MRGSEAPSLDLPPIKEKFTKHLEMKKQSEHEKPKNGSCFK